MEHLRTKQKFLSKVELPNPPAGDIKLNVYPFIHDGSKIQLPYQFKQYEDVLNQIMKSVPIQKDAQEHYVTIDSKFFTEEDFLRREGVHIDGNFCADPYFEGTTWGGTGTTWGGTKTTPDLKIHTKFVNEQGLIPPIGTYVSDVLGGIITVSNEVGCQMWGGDFNGKVGDEGDFSSMEDQLTDDRKVILDKDEVWIMSSNTPHETLKIEQGKKRTFLRITLNHKYRNEKLFAA